MHSFNLRPVVLISVGSAALLLLLVVIQQVQADYQLSALEQQSPSSGPVIGRQITLYHPGLDAETPAEHGFTYSDLLGPSAITSFVLTDSITLLDTTAVQSDLAGYGIVEPVDLDPSSGYTIRFAARVVNESHSSEDRAGFSVTALGNDMRGVELGFWEDEVWVQEGGGMPALFTHAEGVPFDTTGGQAGLLTQYQLSVLSGTYFLSAAPIPTESSSIQATGSLSDTSLSGPVRDYRAFSGFPDVYETANFLFLGDNSSRGQAEVNLGMITAIVAEPPASRIITVGGSINIDDLGVIVQTSELLTLSLATEGGSLLVDTAIPGGITVPNLRYISATVMDVPDVGSVTNMTIVADADAINTTLAQPGGLIYQGRAAPLAIPSTSVTSDTITVTLSHGEQTAVQTIGITINPAQPTEETPTSTPQANPTQPATSTPTATPMPGSVQLPPQDLYLPVVVP